MIITIDGPAASGKSTAAKELAHRLGYYYLNSGMLYRVLGYILLHDKKIPLKQLSTIDVHAIDSCLPLIEYGYDKNSDRIQVLVNGADVTQLLKDPEIDNAASLLGSNAYARKALSEYQRFLAQKKVNIVIEGRDAGSVVFPDADLKLFITATPEIRAARWQKDQEARGNNVSYADALVAITARDARDSQRSIAPLKVPEGAVVLDSSNLSKDEIFKKLEEIVKKYL